MVKYILFLLSSIAVSSSAFAIARALDLDSALKEADLIARLTVTSVGPAPKDSGYRNLATANVTNSVKGLPAGSVSLLSDNGYICPNVLYKVGDECIVFAKRRPDGSFETMNQYSGQFRVEDGKVRYYAFRRPETHLPAGASREAITKELEKMVPADEIVTELRERLKKVK
jgi:hypothetical protein